MLRYLKSREFWLTIFGLALLATAFYLIFFFVFLPSYTQHGESVIVPEVTKLELADAIVKLEGEGLRYEVAESLYIAGMSPMAVISQDPPGISKVKPGRSVYLIVNKTIPPTVRVPDIFNVSQYQAKLLLEGANLNISKIEYVPHEHRNLVLAAFIKGKRIKVGDTLPKFSKVMLRVGRGKGSQRVDIPKLVGEHYQVAISTILRAGLNVGSIRFDPDYDAEDGTVYIQNPRYRDGDSINVGSEINLLIAGKEPPEALELMIFDEEEDSSEVDETVPEPTDSLKEMRPSTGSRSGKSEMNSEPKEGKKEEIPEFDGM